MTDIDTRETLRVFYHPKEKEPTPARRYEAKLLDRIAELKDYIATLEDALLAGAP